jgi:predicted DNA-binding protein
MENVQIAARIPVDLHRQFKAACARRGLVMGQVLRGRIEDWLEEVEDTTPHQEGDTNSKEVVNDWGT